MSYSCLRKYLKKVVLATFCCPAQSFVGLLRTRRRNTEADVCESINPASSVCRFTPRASSPVRRETIFVCLFVLRRHAEHFSRNRVKTPFRAWPPVVCVPVGRREEEMVRMVWPAPTSWRLFQLTHVCFAVSGECVCFCGGGRWLRRRRNGIGVDTGVWVLARRTWSRNGCSSGISGGRELQHQHIDVHQSIHETIDIKSGDGANVQYNQNKPPEWCNRQARRQAKSITVCLHGVCVCRAVCLWLCMSVRFKCRTFLLDSSPICIHIECAFEMRKHTTRVIKWVNCPKVSSLECASRLTHQHTPLWMRLPLTYCVNHASQKIPFNRKRFIFYLQFIANSFI